MPELVATTPTGHEPTPAEVMDHIAQRRERFNRLMAMLGIPVRITNGLPGFIACPECGGRLHWSWRQRDLTHDAFARCLAPGCHWAMWRSDMPDAVRDVYGWEVV